MSKRKILITGGCGFVGANLAFRLAARGDDIAIYDDFSRKGSELNKKFLQEQFSNIKVIKGNIKDIKQSFFEEEKFDLIYHLAAQVAVTTSYEDPLADFETNALGSFLIAQSGVPVIYASTNKVYGDNVNDVPIEEGDKRYDFAGELKGKGIPESFSIDADEHSLYGVSKLTGEMYVREFNGIVNRFSCMYGEYQYGNIDQGWVSHFIFTKLRNEGITIFGDGKQIRDALYISDVVDLLELEGDMVKELRGAVFNIGGGAKNTISLLELCDRLGLEKTFGDWRPADQKVYYSDISKVKDVIGWEPKVSVDEGITKTLEWAEKIYSQL